MNPIIYTCSSREFRRAFLSTLCCTRCRRRPGTPVSSFPLRARNFDYPQCRATTRQQNNNLGSVRREDIMLDLSHSKKSNSSGSSTFNATSTDHKSSCSGSPTPLDAENAMSTDHSAEYLSMVPCSRSQSFSATDVLKNVALDSLSDENLDCVLKSEPFVPNELEMKESCDFDNSYNSENSKHTHGECNSSPQEFKNSATKSLICDDSYSELPPASSVELLFACDNKNQSSIYPEKSSSSLVSAFASGPSRLDAAGSNPRLASDTADVNGGVERLDELII
ncbi:hypothetical protein ElyMa_000860300 [Elysia marginata]|uniref:Uncharacterized protein n=1 Tax=Elysia marginata TaxID=1093978 RepID=A0AAV4H679_9GAST|nr:hypothetical protein ElyMa_000860300 [Elysia marginata]